jgi:hypothetical protein
MAEFYVDSLRELHGILCICLGLGGEEDFRQQTSVSPVQLSSF